VRGRSSAVSGVSFGEGLISTAMEFPTAPHALVSVGGSVLGELTLDPSRDYQRRTTT